MTAYISRKRFAPQPLVMPLLVIAAALGCLGLIGATVSVYAVAVPYAVGLMILAYWRPDLAFAIILASAPFCYDLGLGPVNIALSDISLMVVLPVMVMRARHPFGNFRRNPVVPTVLGYFAVCCASILINGNLADSVVSMSQMVVYLVIVLFVFSSCIDDPQIIYTGFYGFLASCAVLAIAKIATNNLYVLGLHKNSIGASLSYAVLIAMELWLARRGWQRALMGILLALLLIGLLLSLSRGAWVGATCGTLLILLLRQRFRLFFQIGAIALPILIGCWMLMPQQAKEYASDLRLDSYNIKARLASIDYAYNYFDSSPVLGVGVGLRKDYDATNVVMSTMAETGMLGLFTFLSIYMAFGWSVLRARQSVSATSPLFSLLAIGAALVLCQLTHGLVDHFWGRGSLPAWAGMGIATAVFVRTRDAKSSLQRTLA